MEAILPLALIFNSLTSFLFRQNSNPGATKVMNAPREYYPVGYDKNFDDNFASRVDLPDTTFYCGDQKHFPGLYADEDLGCMVTKTYSYTYNFANLRKISISSKCHNASQMFS